MSTIVIGDGDGFTGIVLADATERNYDIETDMWTVRASDGRTATARTVVDTRSSTDPTVAVHGLPNHFRTPGPDVARQTRFVARCLDLMTRSGLARIEAKSRVTVRRWRPQPVRSRFYLSAAAPDDVDIYDGPVSVTLEDREIPARARLRGHVAAIDGHYHWRGTLTGDLSPDVLHGRRVLTVSIAGRTGQARVVERTPWGSVTVAGDGEPPFGSATRPVTNS
ncbi:DUF4873 domain-containing protein [Mycobacterium sp. SMC-4]|uniref:DUF4873 domain-containing protein n=1 Tax=Mycobacterium sp. SMC-4 TaxID=2857059 RepID=UPI0021B3C5D6|nr:DUF4873 domain-containing protein [Mycobacterium sp. SMC-4]UXA17222.1 DUF4873 domain-containing protein [Mycobacterium sp. SMC-4]